MKLTLSKAQKTLANHLDTRGSGEASRIAEKHNVDQGLVGRWARGERVPNGDNRLNLFEYPGIPMSHWKTDRKVIESNAHEANVCTVTA